MFSFGISNPIGLDYSTPLFLDRNVKIDTIFVVLRTDGGGNDSVVINLHWAASLNAGSPRSVFASDVLVSNATTGVALVPDYSVIKARNWVWLQCKRKSGTVTQIGMTIKGRNE